MDHQYRKEKTQLKTDQLQNDRPFSYISIFVFYIFKRYQKINYVGKQEPNKKKKASSEIMYHKYKNNKKAKN